MDLSFESHWEKHHILEIPSTSPNCSQPQEPKGLSAPFPSFWFCAAICFEWPWILTDLRQKRADTNTSILDHLAFLWKLLLSKESFRLLRNFTLLASVQQNFNSLHCGGFSCGGAGSRRTGFSSRSTWAQQLCSRALEHRLSSCGPWLLPCAFEIFLYQGSNPSLLHW